MTEAKYTPGPWYAEDRDGEYSIVGRPTWPCNRFGEDGEWDVAVVRDLSADDGSAEETCANACLIAAAPELLEALIELKAWIENDCGAECPSDKAEFAIDKAGGRS